MKIISYLLFLFFGLQVQAQVSLDSIIELRNNHPSKAIIEIDKLLFAKEMQDSLLPYLHRERGYAYQNLNDIEKSIDFLEKAQKGFDAKTQAEELLNVEIQLSNNFSNLNKQTDAIKYANSALQRAEVLNNKELIVKANDNISYVYFKLGQLDKAIAYLQISEQYHKKNKNLAELSITYNNIAILYRNKGDLQACIRYNEKSLALNFELKDLASVAKSYNNLGIVYNQLNNTEEATTYFTKAIALNDSLGIKNSNPLISLALLQHQKKEYKNEQETLLKALEIEQQTGRLDIQKSIYQSLLKNSLELNIPNIAQRYQVSIEHIDTQIMQRQRQENLQLIDTHKQLLENELKWREQQQQTITYKWIAVSVFLLAFAFGIYFYQRHTKKEIVRQKERALLEQKILRSQMNPHFIFNALTAIQNKVMENNPLHTATYISRFAKLVRQNFDFTQKEFITLEEDLDALKNYMATQQMRFENKFEYEFKIDERISPDFIKIPPMLLQPFVENAIEHGFKDISHKGKIEILVVQQNKEQIRFKIIDNGKGFFPKHDAKLHALEIIKTRLKLNNANDEATFSIQNRADGSGTEVTFLLTLAQYQ
ncbi:tetratricopeptide repeat protein [Belliella sp. DSM 107340]|uniref:Tetratricopeptide repeat protein n=1 Tax=Belliella calami TaxID=2923436 RepID=A0ABS9USW9_9BACT|nr:tetratricopeptide repeat protein [Belliella calami]MCH7399704.1 tetratricopeptide repeat protein [Belliella calami]